MKKNFLILAVLALVFGFISPPFSMAQEVLKIGYLFPFTGPLAIMGKEAFESWEVVADMVNERGGVLGKKVVAVKADAVDPKNAMSEAERLITIEKVNIIVGTQSSPRALTGSEVTEKYKKIFWEVSAAADELTKRKTQYFFRLQTTASSYGIMGAKYIAKVLAPMMKKPMSELKVVSNYEDSIWGTTVWKGFMEQAKKEGVKVIDSYGYNYKTVDFSGVITKYKSLQPDIVYGSNYMQDFIIMYRQMKQLNFNTKAFIGNGTLCYSDLPESLGTDIDYVFDIQGVGMTNFNLDYITPQTRDLFKEMDQRYVKKFGTKDRPALVLPIMHGLWVLLHDVLPQAGSDNPDAVRQAILKVDVPLKESLMGFGIKFAGPDTTEPGQNVRAVPGVMQWMNKKLWTVYPLEIATAKAQPIMPTWEERAKQAK